MDRLLFLRNSWRESASFASESSDEGVFPGPGGYLMQLVYYPDPILLKTARPLERIDGELREKTSEMFELMYRESGVGLAAPQVGWGVRLFIFNCLGEEDRSGERVFINPRIIDRGEDYLVEEEGCLSVPEVKGKVSRPDEILAEFQDLSGEMRREELCDIESRIFQHEFDHLNGVLFLRHLNTTEKLVAKKMLRELETEYSERGEAAGSGPPVRSGDS